MDKRRLSRLMYSLALRETGEVCRGVPRRTEN